MKNLFKKISIILTISISLFVVSPILKAQAYENTPTTTNTPSNEYETRGVKKWIAKTVIKGIAKALRTGGPIVKKVSKDLGGKEAKYFVKHVDTIADALDSLDFAVEFVEDAIIDTVSSALIGVGVPSGIARTISNVFTFAVF